MKNLMLFLTALFMSCHVMAQQTTVTGIVTDATDGSPVIGANILVKGTSAGAISDIDGNFSVNIPSGYNVLVITCIGYKSQEIVLTPGQRVQNIALREDSELLEEVVVVGYGTSRKVDITGSVSSVSGEDLKKTIATNLDQMMQGKISGVQITQNSGAPGGAASIRIRGAGSINNSNEPLYIIDGVPFSGKGTDIIGFEWAGGTNGQSKVNPLSAIAPSDIVSIDVLKDASATAIYGSDGANGVIMVTTKRGKEGRTNINYDGYLSMQNVAKKVDMMNLREYAQYQLEVCEFLQRTPDAFYGDPSILGKGTDWQDEIFRTAMIQSHQLSIDGGNDRIQFAASGGWMEQEGIIIGSDFTRFNSRLNIDATIYKWLKAGSSLAFTHTEETITNNDGSDGVIMQALTMQPSIPVYNFDGTWAGPNDIYGASQYNPVWLAKMKNNGLERNQVTGSFFLSIDPIKALNIRSEYSFNYTNSHNMAFVPSYSFGIVSNDINQIRDRTDQSSYWLWKNYATFTKSIDKHKFSAMGGMEVSESNWLGSSITKQSLSSNDIHVITSDGEFKNNDGWKDKYTKASFFGRINYNFDERYLLTATMRADGSSKFGPNNKWGYFPSVALAWRINNEAFLKGNEYISNLKLRLGYGQVGNSQIDNYLYGAAMTRMNTPFGTGYRMRNIANPDLGWEAAEQYNLGLDLGLFNERISLALDFYQKDSRNLLLQVPVPSYLGGTEWNDVQTPMVNIGKTRNKGVDITLNTVNIESKNFTWNTNLTFSLNRNEVLALNDDTQKLYGKVDWWSEFQSATVTMVGQPIGVFYGYVAERLFTSKEDILNSAVQVNDPTVNVEAGERPRNLYNQNTGVYVGDIKFKDLNKDGVIDDADQQVIGDPNPDFTFGFTNTFRYKGFDLGITLTGAYGFDILNYARFRTEGMTSIWDNQANKVTERAQVGKDGNGEAYLINTSTMVPRPSTNDFNRNNRMSTRFIEDGSYLRIQNISIGYNLPASLVRKISLQSLRVYVNAQNLYTFTSYSGYDPEIGAYNQSSMLQNIDRGRYPTPRSITFGLNIGL